MFWNVAGLSKQEMTPEDVARAILFLLDPAQDWITGQVLGVDGGLASLKTRQA